MPDRLEELEILIGTQIEAVAETTAIAIETAVATMVTTRMTPQRIRNVLLDDLREGGVIFGAFRNAIRNTTNSAVRMASTEATRQVFENRGVRLYRWVTAGNNVCRDCEPRHGQEDTYEAWEEVGLPRSGFSVCTSNCQCVLVPASYSTEETDGILYRQERTRQLRRKYAESR